LALSKWFLTETASKDLKKAICVVKGVKKDEQPYGKPHEPTGMNHGARGLSSK